MGMDSLDPLPPPGGLSPGQVSSYQRMEPKTLGAVQIVTGCLILCLSASVLQLHEVHFTADVMVFLVVVVTAVLSGSVLVHSGRRPALLWVRCVLVLHFVSAAFATAALGLMSKHLPYRTDSVHCRHCRKMDTPSAVQFCFRRCTDLVEKQCKLLVDGILCTLCVFLLLQLLLCLTAMLFGLSVLASGSAASAAGAGRGGPVYPQTRPPAAPSVHTLAPPTGPPPAVVVTELEQVERPAASADPQAPPTEPQAPPTDPQAPPTDPQAPPTDPQASATELQAGGVEVEVA